MKRSTSAVDAVEARAYGSASPTAAQSARPSLAQLAERGEASIASSLRRVLPVDGAERVTVSAFNSCI